MGNFLKMLQKNKTLVIIVAAVLLLSAAGLIIFLGLPHPENTNTQQSASVTPSQSQPTATPSQSQPTATPSQSQPTATPSQSQPTPTPTTTATVKPSATTSHNKTKVSAGDKVLLTVTAKSVKDMYGYQFQVNYDKSEFEYAGELKSKVDGISTIFAKAFDGYQLIGATMTGNKPGFSGKNVVICVMEFTALKDCVLTNSAPGISKASVVASDLKYTEDVSGWSCKAAATD